MIKLFDKKPVSDHIHVGAFPEAKEKGEMCVFGSLVGFSDYKTEAGAAGSVNIGKTAAVFQMLKTDMPAAAIGTDVYVASDGSFAPAAVSGSRLFGTVVAVGGDTFDIAVTG
jgi:predicted RecA/RadA family phage recombinase